MAPSTFTNPLLSLLLFTFLLPFSIFHPLTTAQPLYQKCQTALNYTSNSTYASNLNTLLTSLPSNASRNNGFYNTTVGRNQDSVNGLVLCRGDVTPAICKTCVDVAIKEIKQLCPNNKVAAIWYEYCQLRYSDKRFFSLMEDAGKITLYNTASINNPTQFVPFLNDLLSNLSNRAANDPSLGMFATEKTKFMGSQDVYGLVQCTRDLSRNDCNRCLEGAIGDVMGCCSSYRGARVLTTSCNLRFELYPFYTASDSGPTPAPPNPTSKDKLLFLVMAQHPRLRSDLTVGSSRTNNPAYEIGQVKPNLDPTLNCCRARPPSLQTSRADLDPTQKTNPAQIDLLLLQVSAIETQFQNPLPILFLPRFDHKTTTRMALATRGGGEQQAAPAVWDSDYVFMPLLILQ
ncbi:cysteine-rich receptor-like protein kinase 25 [Cinnamomum micranthum f. kanehirae]|uniref:Cysteine-rich receptor-like protein kinase 25 n=1 Tax=Cinnamomum micranthum f. kanehirae TaxID=337451 RepID=A0A3S3NX14_9MAGN|nr:cysteine-rich receptor-like protein kinase 25 [Cinnamomum micranthum f. kanehirae]